MLFNSYLFLFAFFPVVYLVYLQLQRAGGQHHLVFLALASLVFYGAWDVAFLPVLMGSIVVNFLCMRLVLSPESPVPASGAVAAGICFNLAVLGYFKYSGFLVDMLFGADSPLSAWTYQGGLPLGISFFTFQQIVYLVDARRGWVRDHSALNHSLFISFFPHAIAGPIIRHNELIPQFSEVRGRNRSYDLGVGLSIFAIGLFKKTVIADTVAVWADKAFAAAGTGQVGCIEAWLGTLAYALQIYYDFSAYSDMAVGLAWMLGVELPLNFFSPYKATSIIEFWRRWHMTLSRFLREYLYYPLGGNRRGVSRQYLNIMVVMLLGGLWHGAGWNFVLWGGLHGIALLVNHAWRSVARRLGLPGAEAAGRARRLAGWLVTLVIVVAAWVPFRAPDFAVTGVMYDAMFVTGPTRIAGEWAVDKGAATGNLERVKRFVILMMRPRSLWPDANDSAEVNVLLNPDSYYPVVLVLCLLLTVTLPNVGQIFAEHWRVHPMQIRSWLRWRPTMSWAVISALLLVAGVSRLGGFSPFLYFQF